ncbi:MAG: DNA-methyltransferase [bacterium]
MNIELYNDDYNNVLKDINYNTIDCIIADLPYNITACKWDKDIIDLDELWKQYNRIVKDDGNIILFGSQPFTSKLIMSNIQNFKCEWIWKKNKGSNFATVKYVPFREHESILIFKKDKSKVKAKYNPIFEERNKAGKERVKYSSSNRVKTDVIDSNSFHKQTERRTNKELRYPSSVQSFNVERTGLHPTQKPVALLEYLIKTYTNENDLVLDNVMGSGSAGVAAKNLNRKFIGIEKDKDYYNIAKERLEYGK